MVVRAQKRYFLEIKKKIKTLKMDLIVQTRFQPGIQKK